MTQPKTLAPIHTWRSAITESDLTSTQRHVALTLALWMNEKGGSAFPGATTLADACGLSVRTVRASLQALVADGWLELVEKGGIKGDRRRANHYRATRPDPKLPVAPLQEDHPCSSCTPATDDTTPATDDRDPCSSCTPSVQEQSKNSPTSGATAPRQRDELFEALVEVSGWQLDALTKTARGRANKAAKELRDIGATPEGVRARAKIHRRKWPELDVTPTSLAANYPSLGTLTAVPTPTSPYSDEQQTAMRNARGLYLAGEDTAARELLAEVGLDLDVLDDQQGAA